MIRLASCCVLAVALWLAPSTVAAETCAVSGPSDFAKALGDAKAAVPSSPKTADVLQWARDQVSFTKNAAPAGLTPEATAVFTSLSATNDWPLRLTGTALLLEEQAGAKAADAAEKRRHKAAPPAGVTADKLEADAVDLETAAAELRVAAGHLRAAPGSGVLTVASAATLAVVLTNPPTTRLRLSFDRVDGLEHVELEWDPAIDEGLARRVTLAAATWSVSASIEPIFLQQGDGSLVIAAQWSELTRGVSQFVLTATHTALVADKGISATTADQVAMTGWPQPRLTMTCLSTPSAIDDERFGRATAAGGDARAFGVAPAIVTETLSILAEIAVERARSGAMQVLKQHFLDPVCGDQGFKLSHLDLTPKDDLVLPRTCELLGSLRLEDALSSGEAVLRSLRDDLRLSVAPALLRKKLGRHAIGPIAEGLLDIVNGAIDRGGFAPADAQLALQLLVSPEVIAQLVPTVIDASVKAELTPLLNKVDKEVLARLCGIKDVATCIADALPDKVTLHDLLAILATKNPAADVAGLKTAIVTALQARVTSDATSDVALAVGAACHARLAIAIVKRCSSGGCTVDQIGALLKDPEQYFAPDTTFPASVCWDSNHKMLAPPASLASLQRLVIEGIELTSPVRTSTGRERAIAAIRLVVDVATRANPDLHDLHLLGDLAIALLEERYDTALAVALRMLDRVPDASKDKVKDLRKLGQLVGAVSSYVSVYRNTKDLDPEAARKARKQALESLIDGATDRRDREGDGILSIGSSVGVGYALSYRRGVDGTIEDDTLGAPALRVPLGVMYQRLPSKDNAHGWHVGIHLIDLGQFVTTGARGQLEDPTWTSFVAPGVEAGLDFRFSKKSSAIFNLSVNATYAPGLFEHTTTQGDVAGAWRFGGALGYYVPFFDLN